MSTVSLTNSTAWELTNPTHPRCCHFRSFALCLHTVFAKTDLLGLLSGSVVSHLSLPAVHATVTLATHTHSITHTIPPWLLTSPPLSTLYYDTSTHTYIHFHFPHHYCTTFFLTNILTTHTITSQTPLPTLPPPPPILRYNGIPQHDFCLLPLAILPDSHYFPESQTVLRLLKSVVLLASTL